MIPFEVCSSDFTRASTLVLSPPTPSGPESLSLLCLDGLHTHRAPRTVTGLNGTYAAWQALKTQWNLTAVKEVSGDFVSLFNEWKQGWNPSKDSMFGLWKEEKGKQRGCFPLSWQWSASKCGDLAGSGHSRKPVRGGPGSGQLVLLTWCSRQLEKTRFLLMPLKENFRWKS